MTAEATDRTSSGGPVDGPVWAGRGHNLPRQTTSFVARADEAAEIQRLLATGDLVTVTGAGGIGKTRLALQVAGGLVDRFPDGVWLAELAPLQDPASVPQTVAAAVGLRAESAQPMVDLLVEFLVTRVALLVLDNCEHLVEACAELAACLLRSCPGVRILATSREPLGVPGEITWRVPSLSFPETDPPGPAERLLEHGAIRLFVERAGAVQPTFALTRENAPAVVEICRRLDGIPLAIELAAARVNALTPEQIAERLTDRFRLLTGGSRVALPRQQTLRGTLDWSHDLLFDPERVLFRRLAVFAGGWTLEAAEAVCAGGAIETAEVLDLLAQLVDKSLVLAEERDGRARYRFLETIREYAAERLGATDEAAPLRARHLAWYAQLAETAEPKLRGAEQDTWLAALESEHANLRAALTWSRDTNAGETMVRLAAALWWVWFVHGHWGSGLAWLEQALALDSSASPARVRALCGAGMLGMMQRKLARAEALARAGVALARDLGDRPGLAMTLSALGLILRVEGAFEAARDTLEEALALARELGDAWCIAQTLDNLGGLAWREGDLDRAEALHGESLALARRSVDARHGAIALENLAVIASRRGDRTGAAKLLAESLELLMQVWDRRRFAMVFSHLAELAAVQDRAAEVARLYGAARTLSEAIGVDCLDVELRPGREASLAAARDRLGAAAFEAAWAEGRTMSLDQTVDQARQVAARIASAGATAAPMPASSHATESPDDHSPLSGREWEVATLVARGLHNREIGDQLVISERTVETHVAHILDKLGLSSRAQIAAWAVEQELLRSPPE